MGRPRTIPRDQAIDRALKVFWEKGYEQTSIADLSAALEGGPSSIYNAFGNKESLFRLAIERYVAQYTGFLAAAELDLDVEPLVLEVLRGAARAYTSPNLPPGCAIMQSGGAPGARHSRAAAITLEVKAAVEQQLERALARAAKTHDTTLAASSRVVAKYLMTTMRGMSQLAIDGASCRELLAVAKVAATACVAR
ncbi:MAG: TetR/AcrR family transcriptional regulator [Myxococcales bacterium]|nr:TetR/AcrR family transcriptional regulator [Myxococcales bacterium]